MTERDKAKDIKEEYDSIMERALREPGVAEVLEMHERVERASVQSIPAGTMVWTTTSTSGPVGRSR